MIRYKPRVFINKFKVLKGLGLLGEEQLKKAISMRPVVVILRVGYEFDKYKGGIFRTETKDPKWEYHAVQAVGYGSSSQGDYYLLKNSYGDNWGINGYMLLEHNNGLPFGRCGILERPAYPIID